VQTGPLGVVASRVVVSTPPPPARPSHRRAIVAAAAMVPVLGFAGLELGGLVAASSAQSQAQDLRNAGKYDQAIAVYRVLEQQGGGVMLLSRGAVNSAPLDAGRTIVDWAQSLDAHGHADQAIALLDNAQTLSGVELPEPDAAQTRADIALRSARTEAAAGHWDVALQRLDQLRDGNPPSALAAAAAQLRPSYALKAAQQLLDANKGILAVAALDDLVQQAGSSPEASQAQQLLPRALLAAGQEALDGHDQSHALSYLQRLVTDFGTSTQAARARVLLRAPQSVTGTVVRGSNPVPRLQLRLGSHFTQVGSGYRTSGPYYYATTDARGDFTVDSVPVGGPYVVELLESTGWTTTVGPDGPAYEFTVQPLTPVDLAFIVLPG
jgi:tetratricopeptide (TPR) repeat protein